MLTEKCPKIIKFLFSSFDLSFYQRAQRNEMRIKPFEDTTTIYVNNQFHVVQSSYWNDFIDLRWKTLE